MLQYRIERRRRSFSTSHPIRICYHQCERSPNLGTPHHCEEAARACWRCCCLYFWRKVTNLSRGTSTSFITVNSCRRSIQLYNVGVFTGLIISTPIVS